ncbi:hypothetical protein [Streptomyces sp. HC307]|uniref:hypothetical protein n=1 Tax=Streptomyces flavusporus TaxID=3385496 RepID=UPI00391730D0
MNPQDETIATGLGPFRFELRELEPTPEAPRALKDGRYAWGGTVGALGAVEVAFPTKHENYPDSYSQVSVTGPGFPLITYLALSYGHRPLLARQELRVDWNPAKIRRGSFRISKQGRALRITAEGRTYRYRQLQNKRNHELIRDGIRVHITRSHWKKPHLISGVCHGPTDALDIGLALVFEGAYTRNLSLPGALVSLPGRILNRLDGL